MLLRFHIWTAGGDIDRCLMFSEQTGSHLKILPSEDALLQSPHPALQQHQHICTCCAVPPGGKRGSPPVPSSTGSEESVELLTSCQSACVEHQSESLQDAE